MKNLGVFSIIAGLTFAALTRAAVADVSVGALDSYLTLKPLVQVSLDDGRKGFLTTNHKFYIQNAVGKLVPAPAGRYMLSDGGNLIVTADSTIDQAAVTRLMVRSNTGL